MRGLFPKQLLVIRIISIISIVFLVLSSYSFVYIASNLFNEEQRVDLVQYLDKYMFYSYIIYFLLLSLKNNKIFIEPGCFLLPISNYLFSFYTIFSFSINFIFIYFAILKFFIYLLVVSNFISSLSASYWLAINILILINLNFAVIFFSLIPSIIKYISLLILASTILLLDVNRMFGSFSLNTAIIEANFNIILIFMITTIIFFLITLKYVASIKLELLYH